MTRLSMGPSSVGPIKDMILATDLDPIARSLADMLNGKTRAKNVRALLLDWADKQNLPV